MRHHITPSHTHTLRFYMFYTVPWHYSTIDMVWCVCVCMWGNRFSPLIATLIFAFGVVKTYMRRISSQLFRLASASQFDDDEEVKGPILRSTLNIEIVLSNRCQEGIFDFIEGMSEWPFVHLHVVSHQSHKFRLFLFTSSVSFPHALIIICICLFIATTTNIFFVDPMNASYCYHDCLSIHVTYCSTTDLFVNYFKFDTDWSTHTRRR